MASNKISEKLVLFFCRLLLSVKQNNFLQIEHPKKILVIRQHNQFGDLLASVSLFRALKQLYPEADLNVLLGTQNFYGVTKNKFIDNYFVFDKNKIFNNNYIKKLWAFLRDNYDLAIVPATVSISLTSSLLARISDAKIRVGPNSLDGRENKFNFLFDCRVDLNWSLKPRRHVADFGQDIVRQFGIYTDNLTSNIEFDQNDKKVANDFFDRLVIGEGELVIGLHVGAGKPRNRWPIENFVKLINRLNRNYSVKFFITGSNADSEQIDYIEEKLTFSPIFVLNKSIPELAAIIERANIFITNDTGIMHVAGATKVKQISLFGPTNPFNWEPIGNDKYSIKNTDDISSITSDEVFELILKLLY